MVVMVIDGGGGGGTAERGRLTRGLKRKGGGGVFFVRARAKKGKGRSFFFSFSLNTCKCDQFNLLSGSSRWRMAHGAGVCASDSAACVAAVFFDVFLQGFFFSFYGVCAVISATCRREVVL